MNTTYYNIIKNIIINKLVYNIQFIIPDNIHLNNYNGRIIISLKDDEKVNIYNTLYNNYILTFYFNVYYNNNNRETRFKKLYGEIVELNKVLNKKIKSFNLILKRRNQIICKYYIIELDNNIKYEILSNSIGLNYDIIKNKSIINNPITDKLYKNTMKNNFGLN